MVNELIKVEVKRKLVAYETYEDGTENCIIVEDPIEYILKDEMKKKEAKWNVNNTRKLE